MSPAERSGAPRQISRCGSGWVACPLCSRSSASTRSSSSKCACRYVVLRPSRSLRDSGAAAILFKLTGTPLPFARCAQNDGVGGAAKKYTSGFGSAGATVFREEGLRALYKGFTAAAVRGRPARARALAAPRCYRPRPFRDALTHACASSLNCARRRVRCRTRRSASDCTCR